jgi:nicotinamide-nucleotide amidase
MTDPVALLIEQGLTIAVAESLTGGQLVASLIDTPGASAAVVGGVVAYDTFLKASVLGVPEALLAERGAVDPEVARHMASGVRTALSVAGRPADVGLATTGVAGPEQQDGQPVGTVWVGLAIGDRVDAYPFLFEGGRGDIRRQAVSAARDILVAALLRGQRE